MLLPDNIKKMLLSIGELSTNNGVSSPEKDRETYYFTGIPNNFNPVDHNKKNKFGLQFIGRVNLECDNFGQAVSTEFAVCENIMVTFDLHLALESSESVESVLDITFERYESLTNSEVVVKAIDALKLEVEADFKSKLKVFMNSAVFFHELFSDEQLAGMQDELQEVCGAVIPFKIFNISNT